MLNMVQADYHFEPANISQSSRSTNERQPRILEQTETGTESMIRFRAHLYDTTWSNLSDHCECVLSHRIEGGNRLGVRLEGTLRDDQVCEFRRDIHIG